MSLPTFDVQGTLFESLGSIAADLFDHKDKYKLFATKIWPLLASRRAELAECYEPENGRPGIEPVVLLGVLIFQFLERAPDRQADGNLPGDQCPPFWEQLWERYVESKLDYKSTEETLQSKRRQAGADCLRLLNWLEPLGAELRDAKGVALLREVFGQQYEIDQSGKLEPVKVHGAGIVQNPHDPDAQWSAKGQGKQKKDWVGYKVQVAETVPSKEAQSSFITSVVTQRAIESDDAGLPATLQTRGAGLGTADGVVR